MKRNCQLHLVGECCLLRHYDKPEGQGEEVDCNQGFRILQVLNTIMLRHSSANRHFASTVYIHVSGQRRHQSAHGERRTLFHWETSVLGQWTLWQCILQHWGPHLRKRCSTAPHRKERPPSEHWTVALLEQCLRNRTAGLQLPQGTINLDLKTGPYSLGDWEVEASEGW